MGEAGTVVQVSISPGGVPKLPVAEGAVTSLGLQGDAHTDTRNHGGPDRALCLYSLEVIESLQGEGHPIFPGAAGENLTISGIDWAAVTPGATLAIGDEVVVEITRYTTPCSKNAAWFAGGQFLRMSQDYHPGYSRTYARVLRTGTVRAGDPVRLEPPAAGA